MILCCEECFCLPEPLTLYVWCIYVHIFYELILSCFFLTRIKCGQSCINIIFGPIEVSTERDEDRQKRVSLQNRNLTLNFNQPDMTSSDADGYNQESFCLFIEILILKSIYIFDKTH